MTRMERVALVWPIILDDDGAFGTLHFRPSGTQPPLCSYNHPEAQKCNVGAAAITLPVELGLMSLTPECLVFLSASSVFLKPPRRMMYCHSLISPYPLYHHPHFGVNTPNS